MDGRGDILSIKNREERMGKENHCRTVKMEEFKNFIENMKLIDIQVIGSLFTWMKPNGNAVIIIYLIFPSNELISKWDVVAQEVGKRDLSDHKLVWIKTCKFDWGPKTF